MNCVHCQWACLLHLSFSAHAQCVRHNVIFSCFFKSFFHSLRQEWEILQTLAKITAGQFTKLFVHRKGLHLGTAQSVNSMGSDSIQMSFRSQKDLGCAWNPPPTALSASIRPSTGELISPQPDQEGNKLQRQKILSFMYPIYNHNWRNISTIYIYIQTSIKRNILTTKQNASGSRSG